jgi:hypothetical protein
LKWLLLQVAPKKNSLSMTWVCQCQVLVWLVLRVAEVGVVLAAVLVDSVTFSVWPVSLVHLWLYPMTTTMSQAQLLTLNLSPRIH